MQENVVSSATPRSGLQGISMPCTSLQVNESTFHLDIKHFGPFNFVLMIVVTCQPLSLFSFSDLKEHLRRLQQQSDSRRRAAVMEMMRQRAAEVAGGSS